MIAVCEPFCRGKEHAPVNGALLQVIAYAHPYTPIRLLAEASHCEEVKAHARPAPVTFQEVDVAPRGASFAGRFGQDFALLWPLVRDYAAGRYKRLVVTSAPAPILLALKLAAMRARPLRPIQVIHHGYLADLAGWRSRNPLRRMTDTRGSLVFPGNRYLQHIVLESAIERALLRRVPRLQGRVATLPHPIDPEESESTPVRSLSLPIRIAFLGLATEEKGFSAFCGIAKRVHAVCADTVEFHVIGRLPAGRTGPGDSALTAGPAEDRLSRGEYVERLRQMHYVCLPFQGAHYAWSASGVLLDAIAHRKPALTLPSPIVADMLRVSPAMGVISHTEDALTDQIVRIARDLPQEEYARSAKELENIRWARSPSALANTWNRLSEV